MSGKKKAARALLSRYIISNLLILLIPLLVAIAYYVVSSRSIEKSIDAIVHLQLERNINFIDQRLKGLEEQSSQLMVDYELNKYLNLEGEFNPIDLYNSGRISTRLSSIVISGDFLSRSFVYLANSDRVIMDNGFSEYTSFYSTLFSVRGFDADSWKRKHLLDRGHSPYLLSDVESSEEGLSHPSHIYFRPIGKGEYYRGSFVAIINALALGRTLTELPELYGGWVLVSDKTDNLIACSSIEKGKELAGFIKGKDTLNNIIINNQKYLVYSKKSSHNQWKYTAFLNENLINSDLIKVRNTALILLLLAFIMGVTFSYAAALTNSLPLSRLFNILKINQDTGVLQVNVLYTHLEKSILKLADTKNELEQEIRSATLTTQTYFLQSLIRGEYHNRARFAMDRDRLNVVLGAGSYFVIVCRLSTIAIASDSRTHGEVLSALYLRLTENIKKDEFVLQTSSGSLVIILRTGSEDSFRTVALTFINRILGNIADNLKENLLFGIGDFVSDPFLLPISFNEAEASSLAISREMRNPICFYKDFPASDFTYIYPLHVEEAICRAVRGANKELLNSILEGVKDDNLIKRTLGRLETENLILALRGTALRLTNEFPRELAVFSERLNSVFVNPEDRGTFDNSAEILYLMAEERSKGKRSHNDKMAILIREYITDNFRDFNMGLSSIAERFNLSENYLSSFFKENEGVGVSHYIQRIRMAEAASLLTIRYEISIDKISANCGYPNTASFRRAFKRIYGQSPSEYRNQNSNNK